MLGKKIFLIVTFLFCVFTSLSCEVISVPAQHTEIGATQKTIDEMLKFPSSTSVRPTETHNINPINTRHATPNPGYTIETPPFYFADPTAIIAFPLEIQNEYIYRGGLERQGVYPAPGVKNKPKLLWQFYTQGPVSSTPAIYKDVAFFGSHDGNLYAVEIKSGDLIWRFESEDQIFSSPSISNNAIFFGSDDGHLYALNVNTGKPIWKYKTGGWVRSSPAISDDVIFFGSYDGYFYALNTQTGALLWRFEVSGINASFDAPKINIGSSPAVANGLVLFGTDQVGGASMELSFYGLDASTGNKRWDFPVWNTTTSPAITNNVVYFGGFRFFYGLEIETGEVNLQFSSDIISTAPAIYKNFAFFGKEDGSLSNVNLINGIEVWRFNTDNTIITPPSISDGVLYFCTSNGVLRALDLIDGSLLWEYDSSERISTAPVIFNGMIFFGTDEGNVFALTGN